MVKHINRKNLPISMIAAFVEKIDKFSILNIVIMTLRLPDFLLITLTFLTHVAIVPAKCLSYMRISTPGSETPLV
jgi:hypothetical protein